MRSCIRIRSLFIALSRIVGPELVVMQPLDQHVVRLQGGRLVVRMYFRGFFILKGGCIIVDALVWSGIINKGESRKQMRGFCPVLSS